MLIFVTCAQAVLKYYYYHILISELSKESNTVANFRRQQWLDLNSGNFHEYFCLCQVC